jgi:hypothetical protein
LLDGNDQRHNENVEIELNGELMSTEIQEIRMVLKKLAELRNKTTDLLSELSVPDETKNRLLAGYLDISIEHFDAICLLIEKGLNGSAYVLLRTLFETMHRASWVHHCACEAQIEKISRSDKFRFPSQKDMADQIDKKCSPEDPSFKFFRLIVDTHYGFLSSFTHSGLSPLSRRFKGDDVIPNFDTKEIIALLEAAAIIMFLMAYLFFIAAGDMVRAQVLAELIMSFSPEDENETG